MRIIDEGVAVEVDAATLRRGDHYEFPCGCRVPLLRDRAPLPAGHLPIPYSIEDVPLDCPAVYSMLSSGRTKGVFQLESPLAKQWTKRLQPQNIEHLSALVALLRPGCLASKDDRGVSMTELFCRRKNGEEPVEIAIEAVRSILEPTYDVMCYQEQLMRMSQVLAGFDLVEVDTLRKCVTGDTMFVSKTRGWISIHRLLEEGYEDDLFLVMGPDGVQQWKQVEKIWPTGKQEVAKVQTKEGAFVRATSKHQFLTDVDWKTRESLADGDNLVGVRKVSYDGHDSISRDLALVIAGIVAEGTFSDKHNKVARFVNHDAYMMSEFIRSFRGAFGHEDFWHSRDGYQVELRIKERLVLEKYIEYGKSETRRLPDCMMGMTKESTADFLSYLLACEGGVTEKSGQFEFASKSPILPFQVKLLLLRFGIRSSYRYYEDKKRCRLIVQRIEDRRLLHQNLTHLWPEGKVRSLEQGLERFNNFTTDTIPPTITSRMIEEHPDALKGEKSRVLVRNISRARFSRLAERTGSFYWAALPHGRQCYEPIRSVEEESNSVETFDFTVAGGDTPYIVANGLVIHNSVGKKDQKLLTQVGEKFVEKAAAHGVINREQAEAVFENIRKSGRYLFNKSHSVSYAINAYWTAHWKAHFPLQFYCSYLRWAAEKSDPLKEIRQLVADAKYFGIEVLPPRFSELRRHFSIADGVRVTFGLADVKGVGDTVYDKIVRKTRETEAELGSEAVSWDWYTFLTRASDAFGASAVRRMIEVGALRDLPHHRQRMLAEHDVWGRLTDTEKRHVWGLGDPIHEIDPARPVSNLEDALEQLLQRVLGHTKGTKKSPSKPKYAVAAKRRDVVQSLLDLLRRPPSPLQDTPYFLASKEEEGLGIPLTASQVEGVDRSQVNCTVREYANGFEPRGGTYIFAVEIEEVHEREVANGDNRGRKMGRLFVRDETGLLDDVVAFPDTWDKCGTVLRRAGSVVALKGKRSYRDRSSFFVDDAWLL